MDDMIVPLDWSPSGNIHLDASGTYMTINPDPTGIMQDGKHSFILTGKDAAGNAMKAKSWLFTVDRNQSYPGASTMIPLTAAASLNLTTGSYIGGTTNLTGRVFDQTILRYVVALYDTSTGSLVQTIVSSGRNVIDGVLGKFGSVLYNGFYRLLLTLTDRAGNVLTSEAGVNIDNVLPTAAVTSPLTKTAVSGTCPVIGTAADANLSYYTVEVGAGTAPTSWTTVSTGYSPVIGAELASLDSASLSDGLYTLRLTVYDKSNNKTLVLVPALMIEHDAPAILSAPPTATGSAASARSPAR